MSRKKNALQGLDVRARVLAETQLEIEKARREELEAQLRAQAVPAQVVPPASVTKTARQELAEIRAQGNGFMTAVWLNEPSNRARLNAELDAESPPVSFNNYPATPGR